MATTNYYESVQHTSEEQKGQERKNFSQTFTTVASKL